MVSPSIVKTNASVTLEGTFHAARMDHHLEALSMPSGTGKTVVSAAYQQENPTCVRLVSLSQPGVLAALQRIASEVAPEIFPVQQRLFHDDILIPIRTAPCMPAAETISHLHLACRAWVARACATTQKPQLLLIVEDVQRLQRARSINDLIIYLDEACSGLPIGVVFLGDARFHLPVSTAGGPLFGRTRRAYSITTAIDRLHDVTTFNYSDVSAQDIARFLRFHNADPGVAPVITQWRKQRGLCPSFRVIERLVKELQSTENEGVSVDDILSFILNAPPPVARFAA